MVFVLWWRSGQTLDVENTVTFRGELLYWTAMLFSNSLGTSSGDFLADSLGLGNREPMTRRNTVDNFCDRKYVTA